MAKAKKDETPVEEPEKAPEPVKDPNIEPDAADRLAELVKAQRKSQGEPAE